MPLTLIATPIGNPDDISLRAQKALEASDVIILEERKEGSAFLRSVGIRAPSFRLLNEHTTIEEIRELAQICSEKKVSLITDCGTPGFCDPGADLVAACRAQGIPVSSLPGASSLMLLLSLTSERTSQFLFRGFLAAESEQRQRDWRKLQSEKLPMVLMDTPYRFQKMLQELKENFSHRKILVAANLTQESEIQWEGLGKDLNPSNFPKKAEFMIFIYGSQ